MTYFPLGLLASASSEIMYIQLHRRKTIKRKILTKQKDSFKIKIDKNVKICLHSSSVCCFAADLLSFIKILKYTAHYMTVSQSIILN